MKKRWLVLQLLILTAAGLFSIDYFRDANYAVLSKTSVPLGFVVLCIVAGFAIVLSRR